MTARLHPEDVAALAEQLAGHLTAAPRAGLLTTKQVQSWLNVSADWVRDHQADLGAIRLSGPAAGAGGGAVRFDPVLVERFVRAHRVAPDPAPAPAGRPGRKRAGGVDLLPLPDGAR